jgi:hypothetical protein
MLSHRATPTYLIVYAVSVLAFGYSAEPSLAADYLRVAALAGTVVVIAWVLEIATLHTINWRATPAERRRGQPPARVWGMGVAFLLTMSALIRDVIDLLHGPIRPGGVPLLAAALVASAYWLWPLRSDEWSWRRRIAQAGT